MPLIHKRQFQVRYYECDAYGHLNNTNYLRFMLESEMSASAAAGFGIERCEALGRRPVRHAAEVEYLRPLRYGDKVELHTTVAACAGSQVRWTSEFRLHEGGDVAARAWSECQFVESLSGQPVDLPDEWVRALCPEQGGMISSLPEREPFPPLPPPPPGVYKVKRRVAWHDLDASGQVNEAAYLVYTEDCGMGVVEAHGWPPERMTAEGFAIILRKQQIEYLTPACPGESLEVATWASEVKRVSALRHYTVSRTSDGTTLSRVHALGVWIDLATGRPMRIPAGFMDDFAPNLVP